MYDRGDVTPFGQALSYCYMKQVWAYLQGGVAIRRKTRRSRGSSTANKWRKRGIAMIPVKYGSGYNLLLLEQSAAIVVVNQADGTVVIHQGGVEIGQGLVTQAQQVAAYVLNVPMEMIYIDNVNTGIMPNPTSTGASTGTPYTAEAVKQTCQELRERLMEFGYQHAQRERRRLVQASRASTSGTTPSRAGPATVTANGRTGADLAAPGRAGFPQRVNLVSHVHGEDPRRRGAGAGDDLQGCGRSARHSGHRRASKTPSWAAGSTRSWALRTRPPVGGRSRHPDRRDQDPQLRYRVRHGLEHEPGHRHRPGRRRLRAGHRLPADREAGVRAGRRRKGPPQHGQYLALQNPGDDHDPAGNEHLPVPAEQPIGGRHPRRPQRDLLGQGSRRAAAGAGQQRLLRHQGRHPRLPHRARPRGLFRFDAPATVQEVRRACEVSTADLA